jgi:hypothetical protein
MATISTKIENGVLTISTEGHPDIVCRPEDYSDAIRDYATLHGLKQRICDAAALSVVDGRRPTPGEKYAEMKRLDDAMRATGEWKRTGAGEGSTGSDGLLVRALAELLSIPLDEARASVAGMDKATQAAMRGDAEIAPIIARLRVARTPKGPVTVDTRGILARMRGGSAPVPPGFDDAPM